jgi:multidrug efflux pump subunit AcrA (membrane-fusion protein)
VSESHLTVASAPAASEGFVDAELWRAFNGALARHPLDPGATAGFCTAWLDLLCAALPQALAGVVVLTDDRGRLGSQAWWSRPEDDAPEEAREARHRDLEAVCEAAADAGKGVVVLAARPGSGGSRTLAFPVHQEGALAGVAAVMVEPCEEPALQGAMRHLQWSLAWLERFLLRRDGSGAGARPVVMDLLALALEGETARASAMAVATELAGRTGCDRVAIGFLRGRHTALHALSHSADFADRSNLVRGFEALMDEALDQGGAVLWPRPEGAAQIDREHGAFARDHDVAGLCTVPLVVAGETVGGLTLARGDGPLDDEAVETARQVALFVGPALERQRLADRGPHRVAWDGLRGGLRALLGSGAVGLKLTAFAVTAALLFCLLATGTWRVTADAVLEGTVRRVITAPLDGFVTSAERRPGERIRAGEVLAVLDDRELRLERMKWQSEREQLVRQQREALAASDAAEARIVRARVEQADAQLELLDDQIARLAVRAPLGGIVVAGDLSRQLGAPVEKGAVLFEIAPLDRYRVVLLVDESDVLAVAPGQRGELALAAITDRTVPFSVAAVTPVSVADEGRNRYRVEAELEGAVERLRPGMEGVGRIAAGRRSLLWVWTHALGDWLRLRLWALGL